LEFWFRRKYNLAPSDPRFLDVTIEEIEADFCAHQYAEKPPADEVEDDDFDLEAERRKIEQQAEEDVEDLINHDYQNPG